MNNLRALSGIAGIILVIAGAGWATFSLSRLFLPSAGEVLAALFVPAALCALGIALPLLVFNLSKNASKMEEEKAKLRADSYSLTEAYNYDTVGEALRARMEVWERNGVAYSKPALELRSIREMVQGLQAVSAWFDSSLELELHSALHEALGKAETDILRSLSAFVRYCGSVTEHDLFGSAEQAAPSTPFAKVCGGLRVNLNDVTAVYRSLRDDIITNGVSGDGYKKIKEQLGKVSDFIKEDTI
jgi:hypothetical protein